MAMTIVVTEPPVLAAPLGADPSIDDDIAFRAVHSRDRRFDGRLFVGVLSTGIYCRPS